ncbi:type VII secretion integral membrane protein EccD [Streptomyces sp. NBC_00006]|uniref:type VII secretion integral membrane protein EccD n=1 Tax=unclassified Streptomyces TaxID=2593676 RepID=UPI0022539D3B|nr:MULTISPECIES: type VII secretion integral membrane protein EccD [unclassified Streptomyces]MCX4829812.1 type VII secretion integral membrane protein EccD [Streptomyces sp. NBC_01016]MCX5530858.1 type VII secretion integral membrane protein EccD [Streptomyces sp. NBC_00006]
MSTTALAGGGTGFCRVTVAAPDARIDVALPEDAALADIYPEILQLSGQSQAEGDPTGYHLVRRDGTVLDAGRSLADQRVLDGDVLMLRPFSESLPAAVFDDVSDAVASAVRRDRRRWSDDLMSVVGLGAGVLLLSLMAFALWFSNPIKRDMHSLPGIIAGVVGVLLVALSVVRARVYDDRAASTSLGLAALPHLLIAGSGIFPTGADSGPGRLQLLSGCVVVLIASALLVVLLPHGDAVFVAAALGSAIGALATFGALMTEASPSEVAGVTAVVAIIALAWLPGMSARSARLPIGYRSPDQISQGRDYGRDEEEHIDFDRIGAQVRRAHELLLGLVIGCAALAVASAGVVLGFSDDVWAQLLALAAGIALMLRARLFDYTAQVASLVVGGLVILGLLILGVTLNTPHALLQSFIQGDSAPLNIHILWFAAAIGGGAALLVIVGLSVPRKGVSPFWGRMLDLFDGFVLLTLVPLCLAVLGLYTQVRSMVS